ncbi:phosphoenolpyruvate--protein phosphotransferase [Paractinoplanes rishiriensis]|uniref:Phosphocarrier protein HPr n=1 Tax=Paractinoplanes rishiriensis TaxID=1050105 RepID=A0A919K7U2_9ACTN|nr:phosphoenolpyruvate--protein phosphotransferase [Actinoplanes rishiriensis]GIF00496.1 multiphosphoryl transfer protein (MTP) [Actinoplanes rishiriensis]
MVGLVVVSHSHALARAAVALATEMAAVPIEVAAGLDEDTFGTDATAIASAVTAADRGDGVVLLMDLGSAVLSAELALELLPDEALRDRVLLCPAPLVEGLVAAAVAAAGGAARDEVAAEALDALAGKQSHFGTPPGPEPQSRREADAVLTVTNPHGLHARPAARLVTVARSFDAGVELRNRTTGSPWVPAASLSRVATLGALRGHEIEVRASGPQARPAVEAVLALAARAFDDAPESEAPPAAGAVPISPGIAVGPARRHDRVRSELPDVRPGAAGEEWCRLEAALATVRQQLTGLRAASPVFDAHLLLLEDADLLADVRARVDDGAGAPRAWAAAMERLAGEFAALPDAYLNGRAADVRAVADQVLHVLLGGTEPAPAPVDGILIAADLTPAEAATLDAAGVLLAGGSPTSHAAILVRGRGIPAIVGLGPAVLEIPDGQPLAFDGGSGEIVVEPSDAVLESFRRRVRRRVVTFEEAVTRDGVSIVVGANLGSVADARAAAANGADLAGLVRTEFLFLDARPGVDAQEAAYREIGNALGGRRVTLRTLDVGGDKPLPYLPRAAEANPFLGVRGIRHSLAHPELLADQLLAIVRVAREFPVSVMFPMVSAVDEVIRARALLDAAIARDGRGGPAGLRVGIMVEVPAVALKAAAFAPYVDFLSIGTNDLIQYAMAAERGNPALTPLADGCDPGVLRLVDAVCRASRNVAVCGELAADERAVPLLTALGVRELSVSPLLIPAVKEAVRGAGTDRNAVLDLLDLPDAAAVRRALG